MTTLDTRPASTDPASVASDTLAVALELVTATADLNAAARQLEREFSAVKSDIMAMLRSDNDFLRAELARERSLRQEAVAALRASTRVNL